MLKIEKLGSSEEDHAASEEVNSNAASMEDVKRRPLELLIHSFDDQNPFILGSPFSFFPT